MLRTCSALRLVELLPVAVSFSGLDPLGGIVIRMCEHEQNDFRAAHKLNALEKFHRKKGLGNVLEISWSTFLQAHDGISALCARL